MSETQQLISTLKKQLKANDMTYAHVAKKLGKSEATIKRLFSRKGFSLQMFENLCHLIGLDVMELARLAEIQRGGLRRLTEEQEMELVRHPHRLLVAVCALNQWDIKRISSTYRLEEGECLRYLLELDRLGLINLMPGNRIKIKVARDFQWILEGPIHTFFRCHIQMDFLGANFSKNGEYLRFQHAMLTPEANAQFQQKLQKLLAEFTDLHEDCKQAPPEKLFGTSVLVALRPWEPEEFEKLRRSPDVRAF